MKDEQKEFYKKFTHKLFIFTLCLVVFKIVVVDLGLISMLFKDFIYFEDILSFTLVLLIYFFYIIGGLLTFKVGAKKYLYLLLFNVIGMIFYYTYYTEYFTKSFDYVIESPYYDLYSFIYTVLIGVSTIGIFLEHFASDIRGKKKKNK